VDVLKSFTINRETNPIVLFDHKLWYLMVPNMIYRNVILCNKKVGLTSAICKSFFSSCPTSFAGLFTPCIFGSRKKTPAMQ